MTFSPVSAALRVFLDTPSGPLRRRHPARGWACALALAAAALSAPAAAQTCADGGGGTVAVSGAGGETGARVLPGGTCGPDLTAPTITVTPAEGPRTDARTAVEIAWRDDGGLDPYSRSITLNGQDVTGAFTYAGSATDARSRDTLRLVPGTNQLVATICDQVVNCATRTVTYTYTDRTVPAATVSPASNPSGAPQVSVQVHWCDDRSLNAASLEVRLNGALVQGFTFESYPASDGCGAAGTLRGTVTLTAATNTFTATIRDADGNTGTATATYAATATRARPVVTLAQTEDYALASPFDARAAYATPAYVSLDAARSATLRYSSATAAPRATVRLDATSHAASPPFKMSVQLFAPGGVPVPLVGGKTELFYAAEPGTNRLTVQVDAAGMATGVHRYTAAVRSHWADGTFDETTLPVRVLVVNRRSGPFGAGWALAGLPRLHLQTDSSIVLAEGEAAAYFARVAGGWRAPAGDFSKLTLEGGRWYRRFRDSTTVAFDDTGLPLYVRDRFGNQTTFTHLSGRLTTITDPAGKALTLEYDAVGKLSAIRDPGGRVSRFTVDAAGDLARIVDPESGDALRATYDAQHRLAGRTDRRGGVWTFVYDGAGTVAADSIPRVAAEGTTLRPATRFRSAEAASLAPAGTGSFAIPAPRVDPARLRAASFSPRGDSTLVSFDRFGGTVWMQDPLGQVTVVERDSLSRVTRVLPASGMVTSYTYTDADLTAVCECAGAPGPNDPVSYVEYGAFGLPTRVHGSRPETRYWYGARGQLDSIAVGTGTGRAVTRYEHDARGRVTSVLDPAGHSTRYHYGSSGWMNTDSVVASRGRTAYAHDAHGRTVLVRGPLERVDTLAYDALNRVVRGAAPGAAVGFAYDALFATTVTDPEAKTFRYWPNALGWADSLATPGGGGARFTYNRDGSVRTRTNRRGQTVTYAYDALGALRSVTADGKTTTYGYDPAGMWVAATNAEGTDTIRFDGLSTGAVREAISVRGGTRYVVSYTRDAALGVVGSLALTVGGRVRGGVVYEYDRATGRLSGVRDFSGQLTGLSYNADGQPTQIRFPTGDVLTLRYPSNHRLGGMEFANPNLNTALGRFYSYDSHGAMAQESDTAQVNYRRYTYDPLGRLTQSADYRRESAPSCTWDPDFGERCTDVPGEVVLQQSVAYTYDRAGNRTDRGAVYTPGSNRLTSVDGYTLEYDADGNLTRKFKSGVIDQRLFWSALGQLDSVRTGAVTTRYGYDGWGRRIRQDATRFVYDRDDLLAEFPADTTGIVEYTHFPGVDQPLAARSGGRTTYYVLDGKGNVSGRISGPGTLEARLRYTPWGAAELTTGTPGRLRFKGREFDVQTGLYYVRERWYDPQIGRFVSEDPSGLEGGINPYAFADNDPVDLADPTGLATCRRTGASIGNGPIYWGPPPPGCAGYNPRGEWASGGTADEPPLVDDPRHRPDDALDPRRERVEQVLDGARALARELVDCTSDHYGLGDLSIRGVSWLGAMPIDKQAHGLRVLPGASTHTNLISYIGIKHFRGVKAGGRYLGSARLFGVLGRANLLIGAGLLAYDVTSIGMCMADS
ncbi:MAG TPA: RHS repeat-associated core domain-containing protein [Longimicrobium sp.]|nr:RHS repeat-associated core domain-containing protein [Longimicrobium sp.]